MKSIIINVMQEETRIAVLKDNKLWSLEFERPCHANLVGNIYKGRVQNVLPGMQAAFVDIGKNKNAFLFLGDENSIDLNQRLCVGEYVNIQITKDEVGAKGPRATRRISIPGRTIVLMPLTEYIGTSHRIESEEERKRLFEIVKEICPKGMGAIIRTAAAGQSKEAIAKDMSYLVKLWQTIEARSRHTKSTSLLYRDVDLVIRIVRDLFSNDIDKLLIDDLQVYKRVLELVKAISPELCERISFYEGKDIFKEYGLQEELLNLMDNKVKLSSGGFLVIDKTEALTVIDVNTGSFVGDINLADTIFRLNQEAAEEIMRQIRLRDLGGMILIDFIDMEKEKYKEALLQQLRGLASEDRIKTNVLDITALGLVEITRKKTRYDFMTMLQVACPVCGGTGTIASGETLAIRICRRIRQGDVIGSGINGYEVRVAPEVAKELKMADFFRDIQKEYGITISITGDKEVLPGCYELLRKN